MASSEKPISLQQQKQQQALKCPRCDSSNTKFCYYNNYNLSQPRHFCKACKRYWTKGGTLRNVPVGGGCRKNKRMKVPPITTTAAATSAPVDHNPNPNPNLDQLPSSTISNNNSNHHLNPLFYGLLPQNPNYLRFDSRVPNVNATMASGYEFLQPRMNVPGLGFSASDPGAPLVANVSHNSSLLHSSYPSSMFVGSTSSSTSAPTTASLLASSLQQQQRMMGFAAYEDEGGSVMKDHVKMEGTQNKMDWNNKFHGQNNDDQIEAVVGSPADPNSLLWSTAAGGGGGDWLDPTNKLVPQFLP